MAEGADCGSVNTAKRRQPAGRKSRSSQQKKTFSSRVTLRSAPMLKELTVSSAGVSGSFNEELKVFNKFKDEL